MSEQPTPYGHSPHVKPATRIRIPHLKQMKVEGRKWAMLTAYDMYNAAIFEDAGIPVLLVGTPTCARSFMPRQKTLHRM